MQLSSAFRWELLTSGRSLRVWAHIARLAEDVSLGCIGLERRRRFKRLLWTTRDYFVSMKVLSTRAIKKKDCFRMMLFLSYICHERIVVADHSLKGQKKLVDRHQVSGRRSVQPRWRP